MRSSDSQNFSNSLIAALIVFHPLAAAPGTLLSLGGGGACEKSRDGCLKIPHDSMSSCCGKVFVSHLF